MRGLIPDRARRAAIAEILADAVLSANTATMLHWSFTLRADLYRLNVGRIEVLSGVRGGLGYVLFSASVPESLTSRLGPGYVSVGGSCRLEVGYAKAAATWRLVRPSWDSLVSRAARSALAGSRKSAHCDRLIDHLSRVTGRKLPQPGWYEAQK
jgi:hypothetical protein